MSLRRNPVILVILAYFTASLFPVSAEADGREIVEMDEVEVVAEAEAMAPPPAVKKPEAARIDNLPTGGDPFAVVGYEHAVTDDAAIADPGYSRIDTVGGFTRKNRSFSVYGADADLNTYWFDFIRIPMNKHSDTDAPVIPVWAIDGIEISKGTAPLESGPGIGGHFRAVPLESFSKDTQFILAPDSTLVNFTWRQRLGDDSGFVLSASKSVTELMYPLLYKGMDIYYELLGMDFLEGDSAMIPSFGDLCGHWFRRDGAHRFSASALAYYDFTYGGLDMLGEYDVGSNSFPIFGAGGIKWAWNPDGSFGNEAYAYASWQHRKGETNLALDIWSFMEGLAQTPSLGMTPEEFTRFKASYSASLDGEGYGKFKPEFMVWSVDGGERATLFLGAASLDLGVQARYARYEGRYEGFEKFDITMFGMAWKENYEVSPVAAAGDVARIYGFGKASWEGGGLALSLGGSGAWYPLHGSAFPGAEFSGSWRGDGPHSLEWKAGWSSAAFEEYVFAERLLNEEILKSGTRSSWARLPASVAGTVVGKWKQDKVEVSLEPYGAWYYDLSGLALHLAYSDPFGAIGKADTLKTLKSLDPDVGRSFGGTVSAELPLGAGWEFRGGYTAASTEYRNRVDGLWFRSNSDARHALKCGAFYADPAFEFALTLSAYVDRPFTPERVVSPGVLAKEPFNSAVDLVPRFSLGTNIQWESDWLFGLKGRYEVNVGNLLAFLNPKLVGMRADAMGTVGASTSDFANREYQWIRNDLMEIFGAMKIKIGGTYFF